MENNNDGRRIHGYDNQGIGSSLGCRLEKAQKF